MLNTRRVLLLVGCLFLFAGLLAVTFIHTSTDLAAQPAPTDKDKDPGKTPKPCGEGGCMSQAANGATASNGSACTSGTACTNPGLTCSIGGRRCTNYALGGGACTCACM
jgi:hypothetical protein